MDLLVRYIICKVTNKELEGNKIHHKLAPIVYQFALQILASAS